MHDLPESQSLELIPPPGKEPSESPACHNQEKDLVCLSTAEDSPTARSLEVLGSSLFAERKLSAFSIYCPGSPRSDQPLDDPVPAEYAGECSLKCEKEVDQSQLSREKREQARVQTKNLNRFFRSKINQMLREVRDDPSSPCLDVQKASGLLLQLNRSNKIMFCEMREVMVDPWLQERFRVCRSVLLKYIHKGKMGMQSKLTMLKYFNKILNAIKDPHLFRCWK